MRKIPVTRPPEIYRPAAFAAEGFAELSDCAYYVIEMQYPLLGMQHAEPRCFVREQVRGRLIAAAKRLPQGYRLKILDAWRPFALQEELFYTYREKLIADFHLDRVSEAERDRIIAGFVSLPADNRDLPPVHTTGGAVDLTIIRPDGTELPMGTGFDAFTKQTGTAFFERGGDPAVRRNRRLLYSVMTLAGFRNLPTEWWHYDYGDRFWAYYSNTPALYRGVFRKEEIYG